MTDGEYMIHRVGNIFVITYKRHAIGITYKRHVVAQKDFTDELFSLGIVGSNDYTPEAGALIMKWSWDIVAKHKEELKKET